MMSNILFKDKQLRMLLALKDGSQSWYLSTLAKQTSATYVHACNFVNACEALGLTTGEKHGKVKTIKLTEKGFRLAELLEGASTILKTSASAPPSAAQDAQQEPEK